MLTQQEAEYLIKLNKVLVTPNQIVDLIKEKISLDLLSNEDPNYRFRVDISSNKKIILKTSIHHMECNSFIGLLRIDFKGGHKNPTMISDKLPKFLVPFAGKWIKPTEPHMHIYVEGDKALVWAIPLIESDFPIKDLKHPSDLSDLILNFGKKINLISKINIQSAII